mmetsp:Transcript_2290/g.7735  ORF Transcript_2290/g.7735 Transcript_2290/m.7735 type:complete len:368 (+) Transcript_2290:3212-4315(+)
MSARSGLPRRGVDQGLESLLSRTLRRPLRCLPRRLRLRRRPESMCAVQGDPRHARAGRQPEPPAARRRVRVRRLAVRRRESWCLRRRGANVVDFFQVDADGGLSLRERHRALWRRDGRGKLRHRGGRRGRRRTAGRKDRGEARRAQRPTPEGTPAVPEVAPYQGEDRRRRHADRLVDEFRALPGPLSGGLFKSDQGLRFPRRLPLRRRLLQVPLSLVLLRQVTLRHRRTLRPLGSRDFTLRRPAQVPRQAQDRGRPPRGSLERDLRDAALCVRRLAVDLDLRHHLLQLRPLRPRRPTGPSGHRRRALDSVRVETVSTLGDLRRHHDRPLARRRHIRHRPPALAQSARPQSRPRLRRRRRRRRRNERS